MGNVLTLAREKTKHIREPKSNLEWRLQTRAELMKKGFRTTGSLSLDIQLQMPLAPRKQPVKKTITLAEDAPEFCDYCDAPIVDEFINGAIKDGPWADLCVGCHTKVGIGLGTGRGQHYKRISDGNFHQCEMPANPKPL